MYPCTHAPVQVKQRNLTLCEGADPAGDAHFEQGMRLFCRSQEARSCPSRRIHRFRSLCVAARVSAAAAGRAACLRSSESLILPQHTQHLPRRIAANRTAQRTGDAGRPPVGAGGSGAGSRPRGGARGHEDALPCSLALLTTLSDRLRRMGQTGTALECAYRCLQVLEPPHRYDPLRTLDPDVADWRTEGCVGDAPPHSPPLLLSHQPNVGGGGPPYRLLSPHRSLPTQSERAFPRGPIWVAQARPLTNQRLSPTIRPHTRTGTVALDPAAVLSLLKRLRPEGMSRGERLPGKAGRAATDLLQRAVGIKALALSEVGVTSSRLGRSEEAVKARSLCGGFVGPSASASPSALINRPWATLGAAEVAHFPGLMRRAARCPFTPGVRGRARSRRGRSSTTARSGARQRRRSSQTSPRTRRGWRPRLPGAAVAQEVRAAGEGGTALH